VLSPGWDEALIHECFSTGESRFAPDGLMTSTQLIAVNVIHLFVLNLIDARRA
jgi:hypothetical protein